ncbi:helix-turn-helix domain-containing protein [Robertkochia solimangrovi]|uniref:helix-turn-helix domain-containing protein n=1 Tax=Robertkochia solimangrovi TaxID=2213046 RepID=UPI001F553B2B|nr:helix-turn-helix transcriptional regulator [Robertkochia solimangrovi]
MNKGKQLMIATIVKERRMKFNYTQMELAEISNISLRSIQRIENGAVMPRVHTLKILAKILDFPLELITTTDSLNVGKWQTWSFREIIISLLIIIATILLAIAFIAQSSTFPETDFELLLYCASVIGILIFLLQLYWRCKVFR